MKYVAIECADAYTCSGKLREFEFEAENDTAAAEKAAEEAICGEQIRLMTNNDPVIASVIYDYDAAMYAYPEDPVIGSFIEEIMTGDRIVNYYIDGEWTMNE